MNPLIQIIYAFFGTMGFSLLFNIKKKRLLAASLNGAFSWAVYLVFEHFGCHVFICSFAASVFANIVSEILARKLNAPSLVFMIPGLIPMIPGSSLYYTMEAIVNGNYGLAGDKAFILLWTIAGLGAGCAIVLAALDMMRRIKGRKKNAEA